MTSHFILMKAHSDWNIEIFHISQKNEKYSAIIQWDSFHPIPSAILMMTVSYSAIPFLIPDGVAWHLPCWFCSSYFLYLTWRGPSILLMGECDHLFSKCQLSNILTIVVSNLSYSKWLQSILFPSWYILYHSAYSASLLIWPILQPSLYDDDIPIHSSHCQYSMLSVNVPWSDPTSLNQQPFSANRLIVAIHSKWLMTNEKKNRYSSAILQ